ncbi:General substrate transporter [Elaphomyces granulatus]
MESHELLDSSSSPLLASPSSTAKISLIPARFRIYWLAVVLCCGAFLFGYDTGIIGGVLTFDSFHDDFRYQKAEETSVSSMSVGTQQAAAFVGCFAVWPVNNRYGRRLTTMLCSLVFCAGVVLEVVNLHSLPVFYAGRIICGLGVGGSSSVIPIFLSEMSPKEIRGRLGSYYQLMFTFGILISYWVDYGVKFMPPTSLQWQIPLGLQLIPGAVMGFGMLTSGESARWLVSKGYSEKARSSLAWVRASDVEDVEDELSSIQQGIEDEKHAVAGFTLWELLEWPNAHRILLAAGIFLAQQSTGATALAYFGPQFFSLLVGPGTIDLLLTGIFGLVKVASCGFFILFVSDRFGRKPLLLAGAAFMSICMILSSILVKIHDPGRDSGNVVPAATIALIYLNIIAFNLSWGPLPWPYASEIFPTRIREPGVACGVGSHWLFNFFWSSITPYIITSMGWATFLLFGILDMAILAFVHFCLKETARKSLEEINTMFDSGMRRYHSAPTNDTGENDEYDSE